MRKFQNNQGYLYLILKKGCRKHTLKVHRLVASAFIPNPENKPAVNHIDGNKGNNQASNLEWVSTSENLRHAWATGLHGEKTRASCMRNIVLAQAAARFAVRKVTDDDVIQIRLRYRRGRGPYDKGNKDELASEYGLSPKTVYDIIRHKRR
jgi:hypothetical protein